jgi:hypothetical protein
MQIINVLIGSPQGMICGGAYGKLNACKRVVGLRLCQHCAPPKDIFQTSRHVLTPGAHHRDETLLQYLFNTGEVSYTFT